MAYNPYNEVKAVYNAKVNYGKATTDEERKKQNDIATAAREKLKSYDYGDIANQVSADGADAATVKKIMDNWAAKVDTVTGNYKTGVDNPAYNAEIKLASDNNQKLFDQQASDKSMMTDKYGKLENYIYDYNPYESDIGKSIMEGYTWKGAKASDNEIASGAASNSGNIDSFAAANASRQQAAFTNAGKQAVLNDFNTRIGNVQNILSNLGVYLQNQDAGMQRSINMQDNRAQNIFNNEQTALNNDVARKSEIANVTGYVPDEWVVSNNPYMNDDGTIKDKYKDIDFAAVMANAKAAGNTEAYNAAAQARYYKIMGDYKNYGQYDDGNYIVPGSKQTEAARQFDKSMGYNYALIDSEEKMNAENNQNTLDQLTLQKQNISTGYSGVVTNSNGTYYNGALVGDKNGKPSLGYEKTLELLSSGDTSPMVEYAATVYGITSPAANTSAATANVSDWTAFYDSFDDEKTQLFLTDFVKGQIYDKTGSVAGDVLEDTLIEGIKKNAKQYKISKSDAIRILNAFGADTSWLDTYTTNLGGYLVDARYTPTDTPQNQNQTLNKDTPGIGTR